ncbi:MAG TPA: hypothetical protein VHX60_17905 [Acidobacteriaceae bacterium]|jgi:hypothetical protein|nr:hypothetical protein [Acidobacteriaceae bacterium]
MTHAHAFLPQLLAAEMHFNVNWPRFLTSMVVIVGAVAVALWLEMRSTPKKKKKE